MHSSEARPRNDGCLVRPLNRKKPAIAPFDDELETLAPAAEGGHA